MENQLPPAEFNEKHLEFIQNIITRMNSNSFTIKGLSIAALGAVITVLGSSENHHPITMSIFGIVIIGGLWFYDAFYLHQERNYRHLYNAVIEGDLTIPPFSLNTKKLKKKSNYWHAVFSQTILIFYLLQILCLIVFMISIRLNFTGQHTQKHRSEHLCDSSDFRYSGAVPDFKLSPAKP